ncbi:helix-turn-helix transcriptional regulator [Clostridiaceae bacterium M8S5]|nr:helix-turn-helix transcriptional regulator [Clostridiaceae bacterium M8S5]
MKELNIATIISTKRKERGITQNELANYMGVSKASVSKWETGHSYPDILFLPQLATYFNISIDELIGYEPQMSKEDISKLYNKLSKDFSNKPFGEVYETCNTIIKKYYSCFPLLLQISVLLMNHFMLASDKMMQEDILGQIITLCKRIKNDSKDVWLSNQANSIEAICNFQLQQHKTVIELLDGALKPCSDDTTLLAQSYGILGDNGKADEIFQVSIYTNLLQIVSNLSTYLAYCSNKGAKFEETLNRIISICGTFNLDKLHPALMLNAYLSSAIAYSSQHNKIRAIDMLSKYVHICTYLFPINLHGDSYFNRIDNWLEDLDLGTSPPRDEKLVKIDILKSITENNALGSLKNEPQYISLVNKLKDILRRN